MELCDGSASFANSKLPHVDVFVGLRQKLSLVYFISL
jgi:hypothetical protein